MAEGIITLVVDNLVKPAATEIAWLLGLRNELRNLSSEFEAIKKVLQDAETRQIGDEHVRGWLQKLKGVAYDLDDLLDEWIICFGDHQVRNSSCSNLTSLIKHPFQHRKYRKRVDEIKSRLEQIAREKERYQFSDNTSVRRMREERRTDSWVDQTSVIGRDEDKKTLVTKLISEEGSVTCGSGSDKVPTIFILGMGGLGKTTLAKSVFNDERVKEKFGDKRMWVCVGEVFDGEVIMKTMIESWGESVKPSWREQLAEMLKDKLYLLILDDVWNENYEKWKPLQEILNQGAKDSRIVITTRNTGVLAKIRSAYTHELKGLDDDECLSIFKEEVVEPGKEEEYEPLMNIGKQIVGKCGGLPLAVRTVASAVRGRRPTREQWEMVRNSKIWDLKESDEGILPALMLSYTELTPQLKNCFGYCSIFKKDTILKKKELIRLWVSQGYIVLNNTQKDEEVGEEYFMGLLARSMFQEPERDDDGTIRRCKMHDLVHDLAQWVTKEECRIIGNDDANNNSHALSQLAGARHCVVEPEMSFSGINLAGVENLRTLIYSSDDEPIDLVVLKLLKSIRVLNLRNCRIHLHSSKHLGKLVHLRHLKLSGTTFTQLPAVSIAKLKELIYLDLSGTGIKTLPKNIVSLPHLQVINLGQCSRLEELPEGILEMASLKRLNVQGCSELKKLPNGIGRRKDVLVRLSTFPVVAASRDAGGGCSRSNIGELGVTNVRARYLDIYKLEEVGSSDEARSAKLEEKTRLRSLELTWYEMNDVIAAAADGVLEGLRPPPHLPILKIHGYPGHAFPSWMGDGAAFPRLRNVALWDCKNCTQLPPLGQLPSLEKLCIFGLDGVERVGREFFGGPSPTFPCLKYLTFDGMRNWSEWLALSPISSEGKEGSAESPIMPALERLDFFDCPKLEAIPPIVTTSLRRLTVDDSSPMLYHLGILQFLPHCETIAIIGNRWNAMSTEDAHNPLICVVIATTATELPGSLLLHQTALRMLILADLSRLRSLPEELTQLTALQQLIIRNCPKLEAMPPITTSLRRLTVDGSSPMLYHRTFLQFLPHFETIAIIGNSWSAHSTKDAHNPLICIVIGKKATELPAGLLHHHTALRMLILADLSRLRSLPEELTQLTALQQLIIRNCPKLEAMPPIFTTSLRRLTIDYHCPMLYHRSFLQFLPHCETIAIIGNRWNAKSTEDAHNPLICVVIGKMATELPGSLLLHHTALRMLILADLQLLRSLPEELPQLTALQQLTIHNCPELSGRCRVGGDLRSKIAHIPLIRIDGQDTQSA